MIGYTVGAVIMIAAGVQAVWGVETALVSLEELRLKDDLAESGCESRKIGM